jgi:membrane-associated phospholipid phosphatase
MKDIETILDTIGFYGPIIIAFIVCSVLWYRPKYLFLYIVFLFLNNELNKILKLLFREKRPDNPIFFSQIEKYKGAQMFGMPSGHAASVGYSLMFLYILTGVSYWIYTIGFIAALTCIQRWKYRRHTVEQIIIGLFFGMAVAYILLYFL